MTTQTRTKIENEIISDLTLMGCEWWIGDDITLQSVCEHGGIIVVVDANYEHWEEDEEEPTGEVFTNHFFRFKDFTVHEAVEDGRDISDEIDWERIEDELWESANVKLVS